MMQLNIVDVRPYNTINDNSMADQLSKLSKMQEEMESKYKQSQLDHELLL